jgi:hypothetical protein
LEPGFNLSSRSFSNRSSEADVAMARFCPMEGNDTENKSIVKFEIKLFFSQKKEP